MGAWQSMQNVIDVVRANDYNTTADLQRFFDDDAAQLETETSCQYVDAEGYVATLAGPGLGVDIDEAAVRAAAVAGHAWADREWTLPDGTPTTW